MSPTDPRPGRRDLLKVAGVLAVGGATATAVACSPDNDAAGPGEATSSPPSNSASSPAASPSDSASASGSASGSAAVPDGIRVPKADIPEGGGTILPDSDYVVTQPSAGEFRAFSKICTHQQCPVTRIEGANIVCECHGSQFSIEDGSVTSPPAEQPLPSAEVADAGDAVVIVA